MAGEALYYLAENVGLALQGQAKDGDPQRVTTFLKTSLFTEDGLCKVICYGFIAKLSSPSGHRQRKNLFYHDYPLFQRSQTSLLQNMPL